jgi:peptidoglycan/xylan/chitin deacetylase (PgdA/CDA1 family)
MNLTVASTELTSTWDPTLGWDFQCHSHTHPNLQGLTAAEIRWEMEQVNAAFYAQGYNPPTQHAYPYGGYDAVAKTTIAEYRLSGRTVSNALMTFPISDWFEVNATELTEVTSWERITGLVASCISNQTLLHMFTHHVTDSPGQYGCTPAKLARVLDYLVEQQNAGLLEIVTMAEAYDYWSVATDGRAVVVISFDDAYDTDYTTAYPLFQERGIKGTSYIVTGFIGKSGYLSWSMIEEMRTGESSPPKPDLTLSADDITFTPASAEEGEAVTILTSIHNIGDEFATNVLVEFYNASVNPETKIGNYTIGTLGIGASATAETIWIAVAGDHEIYVALDPVNTISESNETNNEVSKIYAARALYVSSDENITHVSSIDIALFTQWPSYQASALITIMDTAGTPIEGATVYGSWSGLYIGDINGVTDVHGQVTLKSDKIEGIGTFTFTVTNIIKADWRYDPIQNRETNDSITCPYVYVYRACVGYH